MPPKKKAEAKTGKAESTPQQPAEDELLAKLAEKELEAASVREKLQRAVAARDALDAEKFTLTTEVDRQRSKLQDINEYLTGELRAKAARLKEVEGQLAAARQELESATVRAQGEVDRAVERCRADLARTAGELAAAQERLRAYDNFIAEEDKLQVQLQALTGEIDELKKAHHKKMMDLERKHAQDRELWKRDSAAAVKAAREEMMALTDNRLETTTKRTILENEQMSGELQYQSRQVQSLVQRNEGLQRELSELRVSLDIAKRGEEELVKKNRLCERTIETLLVRLEDQDAERGGEGQLAAEYQERMAGLEEEVHMAVLQLDERADQVAELGRELQAARGVLEEARAGQRSVAQQLQSCLEKAREELAVAGKAAAAPGSLDDEPLPSQGLETVLQEIPADQRERLLLHLLQHLACRQLS